MKLIGYLQKCNLNSVKRQDAKIIRSRLLLDDYEVNTWLKADGTLKVEISKHTPRGTISRVIIEDLLQNMIEGE